MRQAGLALAERVWSAAAAPPDGRLVVDRLPADTLRALREPS
jgi:hypothetical protein